MGFVSDLLRAWGKFFSTFSKLDCFSCSPENCYNGYQLCKVHFHNFWFLWKFLLTMLETPYRIGSWIYWITDMLQWDLATQTDQICIFPLTEICGSVWLHSSRWWWGQFYGRWLGQRCYSDWRWVDGGTSGKNRRVWNAAFKLRWVNLMKRCSFILPLSQIVSCIC